MSGHKLYTPELLALAMELAHHPLDDALPLMGEARSAACGSVLSLCASLDRAGRIDGLGLQARTCAVGQASAAIFARHAHGCKADQIAQAGRMLRYWLSGEREPPAWGDIAMLEPARGYVGRHGAILLPWLAAGSALSTTPAATK